MDINLFLLLAMVFFIAAFVKGITGLGFSTTCLAILAVILGVKSVLPLIIIPSVASNIIAMYGAGHFRETVSRFWPLLLASVPGLVTGLWLLSGSDNKTSGAILGAILIIYALFAFSKPDLVLPYRLERIAGIPAGFVTGLINGVTGSQVMPLMPFMMSLRLDNNRFVQAVNCSFTLSSLVMAAGLTNLGLMKQQDIIASLSALIFVFPGVQAGTRIRHKLSINAFRSVVLIFLMIMGMGLILA